MNSFAVNNNQNEIFLKKVLWMLILAWYFALASNSDWRLISSVWYGTLALVLLVYLFTFNGRFPLKGLSFELWLLSFIGLGLLSILWSFSSKMCMEVIKNLIVIFVMLLLVHFSLNFGFDVNLVLTSYFVSILINALYIVTMIDLTALGEIQLGVNLLEGWNGNGIGFMMAQGVLFGCYLFKKTKNKLGKVLILLCVVALAFLTIYTGSRTAFIMLVAELILLFWLSHPTRMISNIIITGLVLVGALYLVMNVESFYTVLGSRLEGLFALFTGEGKVDSSADIRDTFIQNGKRWFLEQPAFGYGINNYKVMNQEATGRFTYSHNTFIDIAVGLGIVGLVWYYSVYAYLMVRLLRSFRNNPLNIFLLTALVASFISQYGTVSYYFLYQNLLLMLCFFAVNNTKKENSKDFSIQVT